MNDLALHLLDIVQNSLVAGATFIKVYIGENPVDNQVTMTIGDNGKGMTPQQLERLSDPFFTSRTTRKVGLGVPLLRQAAEQAGGGLEVTSEPGKGTTLSVWFEYSHLDRPPMGDLPNAMVLLISANPLVEFEYTYEYDHRSYCIATPEIREVLDGLPLTDVHVIKMLQEMITENQNDLKVCQIQ